MLLSSKARVTDRVESSRGSKGSDKFAFSTAGPAVSEAGAKLVGKSLNSATRQSSTSATLSSRAVIATNVETVNRISNDNSLSAMISWNSQEGQIPYAATFVRTCE